MCDLTVDDNNEIFSSPDQLLDKKINISMAWFVDFPHSVCVSTHKMSKVIFSTCLDLLAKCLLLLKYAKRFWI